MARKRPGIQGPGRERLRQQWSDIQNIESDEDIENPLWVVGRTPTATEEMRQDFSEQYDVLLGTQDVVPLEDLWPDTSNYGFGPMYSTRVVQHRFVPNPKEDGGQRLNRIIPGLGTVYIKFQKRGDVYAYYNVPLNVYEDFARSSSKGKFINENYPFNDRGSYRNLNGDDSVFY